MQARSSSFIALAILTLAACSSDDGGGSDSDVPFTDVPDVPVETAGDVAAETTEDVAAETTEDAGPETTEDVAAETTGDVGPETTEDVTAETSEDVAAETTEDVAAETTEDVAAETTEDVADTADADVTPECDHACDCPQGERCNAGACELGAEPAFCCDGAACPEGTPCTDAGDLPGLCGVATSPAFGAIVFNEVLIDGATDGDPNGDGDSDPTDDEFVEIANVSGAAIDLGGFVLRERTLPDLPRHTFEAGDTLGAGSVMVIFGGGTAPEDLPGARFVVANADDPGIAFGLSLDNDTDVLELLDDNGELVATFAWGPDAALPALPALADESYTRAPDLTGAFTPHTTAAPPAIFSPGRRADGSTFK